MRLGFFLALFANLFLFFIGLAFDGSRTNEKTMQGLQLHPEKIRLLEPFAVASVPANTLLLMPEPDSSSEPRVVKGPSECIKWEAFQGEASIRRVEKLIQTLHLAQRDVFREDKAVSAFWVYVPPSPSRAAAEQVVIQLKSHGVNDYALVEEDGPWRHAISLGVFLSRSKAQTLWSDLQQKGVVGVQWAKRENTLKQVVFYIRNSPLDLKLRIGSLLHERVEGKINEGSCPISML